MHAGGLAGAVAAEERQDAPGAQRERHAVQHVALAVQGVDSFQRECFEVMINCGMSREIEPPS